MYLLAFLTPFLFLPYTSSQNPTIPVCTSCGDRFPDPNDCSLYQTCQRDACGRYNLQSSPCFSSAKYDPINKICTTNPVNCTAPVLKTPDCKCGDTRLPDPTDKTKYYACILNVSSTVYPTHRFCPPGLIYSDELHRCREDNLYVAPTPAVGYDARTENCIQKETIPNKPIYPGLGCIAEGLYPDPYDCSIYYSCIYNPTCSGYVKFGANCHPGYLFDPVAKICAPPEKVKCLCNSFKIPFSCPSPGVFVDPHDNNKYYICHPFGKCNFFKKRVSCPLGLVYDKRSKLCQEEQHHSSESDSWSSESHSNSKEHSIWSRSSKSSDESYQGHSHEIWWDFKGRCKENGNFAINGKKHHYLYCLQGKPVVKRKCDERMVFDSKSRRCVGDSSSNSKLDLSESFNEKKSVEKIKNGKNTNVNVNVYNIN